MHFKVTIFLASAFESHWQHWTAKRSPCALTVLIGGSIFLWCLYLHICTGISLYFLISAFESHWQHWTVKRSLCALTVLTGGPLPLSPVDNIEQWRDHSVLWQSCWGVDLPVVSVSSYMHWYFLIFSYICLWVSMTTLNSEEIALCSECWPGASICLWVSLTTLNSKEITLCSWQCCWGGSICLWWLYLYICTGISLYFLISAFESQWQHWTVKRSLCALTVLTWGFHLPVVSVSSYMHWYSLYYLISAFESQWQHWTVKRSLCALDSVAGVVHLPVVSVSLYMHWYFLIFSYICLWVSMTTLISEEITLCSECWPGGSICLWVSLTTLNSKEITLCSWQCWPGGSICLWCLYLHICTGISLYFLISAFESQWQHWTMKRSLCALTVLTGGGPSAFESHWQHWTEKRSLCALTVLPGGPSACGVCIFIYALVFPYIFLYLPLSLNDNIEQWRDHSVLWQCCQGGPSACGVCIFIYALVFPYIFLYLPLSLNDNIEQWRDHSVLWQCWPGGIHLPLSLIDNIEQQRDHSVLWHCCQGGPSACGVCIFIYALVFPYIFLYLPLSLNDNIEQWRDHSVLWQCWPGRHPSAFESHWQHWTAKRSLCALTVSWGVHQPVVSVSSYMHWYFLIFSYICLWVSMTTLNSEEITLCSDSVDQGASICLWCLYLYICTGISLYFLISAFESQWQHWNSEEITLCSDSVDLGGPSACDVCIFIYALVFPYIFLYLPLSLNDNIEQWRDHSVLCQCWPGRGPSAFGVYIFIYALVFPYIFLYLPLSLIDNIEQWRDHSVLWECWLRGSICLWDSLTTLNSEEITLCSVSVDWEGVHLALVSVSSYIHRYFLIFSYICLWVSMTTLNSEEITLCSDSVD